MAAFDHRRHSTWAKTFSCQPERYYQPSTPAEIRQIVMLARERGKRIQTVGSGHSPSTLTISDAWYVNLDRFNAAESVDAEKRIVAVQAGMRLFELHELLDKHGLALANLGSISDQSVAGVFATGSHGSTLQHGLLSQHVLSMRLLLSDASIVNCSKSENEDLFEAALISLGGLGIVVSVTLQVDAAFNLHSEQSVRDLSTVLDQWPTIWNEAEYTRVWWFPYSRKCVVWKADRTQERVRPSRKDWYGSLVGYHLYQLLLYIGNWWSSTLPTFERFIFTQQYGWEEGVSSEAIERSDVAFNIDCLFSQFVNEWAIPLNKGPEAIRLLDRWINGDTSAIPNAPSPKGIIVHAPIEIRVTDTRCDDNRPMLDISQKDGPTLFLNAILYRPYLRDPPCTATYYEAFETLMKDYGGRPHWAKNWSHMSKLDLEHAYPRLAQWRKIREGVDAVGMFANDWIAQHLL